jgi:hypothetical protein
MYISQVQSVPGFSGADILAAHHIAEAATAPASPELKRPLRAALLAPATPPPPRAARSSVELEVTVSSVPEANEEEASEALLATDAARLRFRALMTTPACVVDMLSVGPNMHGDSGGGSMGDWISRDGVLVEVIGVLEAAEAGMTAVTEEEEVWSKSSSPTSLLLAVSEDDVNANEGDASAEAAGGAAEWMRNPTNASSVALGPRSSATRRCSIRGKKRSDTSGSQLMMPCKSSIES